MGDKTLRLAALVLWLTIAFALAEELPGGEMFSEMFSSGDIGGEKPMSRDAPCNGVTISLEEKVKAVEMEEFNISLAVVSSSPVSRLLTVTPSWDGLKVLDGGQLEVKIIMIIIVIIVTIVITIANILCL